MQLVNSFLNYFLYWTLGLWHFTKVYAEGNWIWPFLLLNFGPTIRRKEGECWTEADVLYTVDFSLQYISIRTLSAQILHCICGDKDYRKPAKQLHCYRTIWRAMCLEVRSELLFLIKWCLTNNNCGDSFGFSLSL